MESSYRRSTPKKQEKDLLQQLQGRKSKLTGLLEKAESLESSEANSEADISVVEDQFNEASKKFLGDDVTFKLNSQNSELKKQDSRIENLVREKKALELLQRQKDEEIMTLRTQCYNTKRSNEQLKQQVKTLEKSSRPLIRPENLKSLMIGDQGGDTIIDADVYYHVVDLENQVKEKEKYVKELGEENKTLKKILKKAEDDYAKVITKKGNHGHISSSPQKAVPILEKQIRDLKDDVKQLRQEKETLLAVQAAKTEVLQRMMQTQEQQIGDTESTVPDSSRSTISKLMIEIRARDEKLLILEQEVRRLLRYEDTTTDALTQKFHEQPNVPTFQLWTEERKVMQHEIEELKEQNQKQTKLMAAENAKIRSMKDRIETLTGILKQEKRHIPSTSNPSVPQPKILDWDHAIDEQDTISEISSINRSHRQMPPEEESDVVPGEAFDAVQKKLSKVMASFAEQEEEIKHKAKELQDCEIKLKKLERIHDQDKNAWKKRETELTLQISELQKRMDMLEKESKRKTNALRSEMLLKTKKDSSSVESNVQTF